MRLLDRYLLRELFTWLGFCLTGLVVFCVAFDLIGNLNHILEKQLLFKDIVELYLVKLPGLLVFILPVTLLLTLLRVLTTFSRHNEITAMRAAGISLWRLSMPYFLVGVFLSLVVFALNELCVPDSEAKIQQIMDRRAHEHARVNPNILPTMGFPNERDNRTWLWDSFNFKNGVMLNPKVDWQENVGRWNLFARSAEYVNGVWTFYGGFNFSTNDISNLDALAAKLHQPTNAVSQYLAGQLSTNTQALLTHYEALTNTVERTALAGSLKRTLTDDLNHVVRSGPIFDSVRFASVQLPQDVFNSVVEEPRGADLLILNRTLLISAFSQELSRNSLFSVVIAEVGTPSRINTNRITMPQFTETPRDFVIEAKFTQRFQALTANTAGVPIVEILEYLKLHPKLSNKNKWWLNTQLHGRFAGPWSCLVVVLIAIPFGAASGRRNIFVGVAGSIVICFVYFILLKLGLALGTGGLLPGWIAAWLPNAFFGIAGAWLMLRVR